MSTDLVYIRSVTSSGLQGCTVVYKGVQVNSWGECWNPTEAGGRHDNFNHHHDKMMSCFEKLY